VQFLLDGLVPGHHRVEAGLACELIEIPDLPDPAAGSGDVQAARQERRPRIRIRGGRITCMTGVHALTEVALPEPARPLGGPCFGAPSSLTGLLRFLVPDDACGPNGGCWLCRPA
jgi:hypothetical protein